MASCIDIGDIESWEYVDEPTVYDITVQGNHNYYIDAGKEILVHNSGKTYGILQHLFESGAKHNNETITVVAEDVPNLKAGAYRDAQNILSSDEVLRAWWPEINKTDRTFKCLSGSVMEFKSFQDSYDARSGKRDRLFINEANGVKYEIYEQLSLRTTKQTIIDFNPSARFWAHENLEHRDDVEWVITTYRDNAFLDENIRKKIESYEPTEENIKRGTANEYRWMVYGLGKVGRLEGLVFPGFTVLQDWPQDYKWRVFGMDFGYTNDPTTLIEIRYHRGDLYWKEHIYETGLTNPDICKELISIGHDRNELIVADSAEPKSIEEIKRDGWRITGAEKGADSVNQGIDAIKRYKVYIEANSKNLIEEFSSYTWKKDRDGNPMNKPVDEYNHGIDAGRYALSKKILKDRKPLNPALINI
jgi:phage terminase large subunit